MRAAVGGAGAAVAVVTIIVVAIAQTGGAPDRRARLNAEGRGADSATTEQGPPTGSVSGGDTTTTSAATATAGTAYAHPGQIVYPNATTTTGPTPTTGPPSTTATTAAPLPVHGSGVRGTITAGPTCPVERADQPCPPNPVSADVDARDGSGHTVASTQSDADGRYAMSLAPGQYTLVVVTGGSFPRCPDTPITVKPNQVTTADISCDTGIR
jgi:hypothetical protein